MKWSTACPGWEDKLLNRQSIIPPPIFPDQAKQALAIFKQLRVVDLPGKPTFGECCDQWVFDFVGAIFGAYDQETGKQLIREFYLLISKKNTKSTTAAGIMLTAVILCWREEEEHLILAPTKEVADNSFKPAAAMVRADEELSALFHVQDHIRTITHRVSRASLKVVAADTDTVSGKKSGKILVDEHWLFGTRGNSESMLMEATGGQVSREEGWVVYLTTQSDQSPAGVFRDKLIYYRSVRDGEIIDQKSLGVLYEFPQAMLDSKAYLKPENFYVTNPNIGKSVSGEWIEDQLRKKLQATDGSLQQFLAKHLNVEIGLSLRSDNWVGAKFWESCAVAPFSLEDLIERSEVVTFGIDGGGLDDMLGAAAIGREKETGRWLLWTHAWIHPIALERHKQEMPRYKDLQKDGFLTIIDRAGQDFVEVADCVEKIEKAGVLERIGVDRSGLGNILNEIEGRGIKNDRIVGIPQGWQLMGSIKTAERKLSEKALVHSGDGLMMWCAGNARVEARGNAIYITKDASGNGKIDPLMAMFDAVYLMSLNPSARNKKLIMFMVGGRR